MSQSVNDLHVTDHSERHDQFKARMEESLVEGLGFATVISIMTHNKKETLFVLLQIVLKTVQEKPIDIEINLVFENHQSKFAQLFNTYLDVNPEYRRLIFYWIQMLKMKGVVGVKNGFLSEEAYVIIMVSWLQKNFFLTKAQIGHKDLEPEILKEKVPDSADVNLGFAYSLRG